MNKARRDLLHTIKVYFTREMYAEGLAPGADYQTSPDGSTFSLRVRNIWDPTGWQEVLSRPVLTDEDDPGEYLRTSVERAMDEVRRLRMLAEMAAL